MPDDRESTEAPSDLRDHRTVNLESTFGLIHRARAQNEDALERLFARHLTPLNRWASGRLPQCARDMAAVDVAGDSSPRRKGLTRVQERAFSDP